MTLQLLDGVLDRGVITLERLDLQQRASDVGDQSVVTPVGQQLQLLARP